MILDYDAVLKGKKHLHFIGIGGSGMLPIVQILHAEGYRITGSDVGKRRENNNLKTRWRAGFYKDGQPAGYNTVGRLPCDRYIAFAFNTRRQRPRVGAGRRGR